MMAVTETVTGCSKWGRLELNLCVPHYHSRMNMYKLGLGLAGSRYEVTSEVLFSRGSEKRIAESAVRE